MPAQMSKIRFREYNYHVPKLQLFEAYPLVPFLQNHERINSIDVGANTGLWSEAFLRVHGLSVDTHVMIEPMPGNLERLNQRCADHLKPLTDGALKVIQGAAGAAPGTATIHYDKDVTTLASITNESSFGGAGTIELANSLDVPVTTVADAMAENGLDVAHVVKIDVEGYERQVMDGMEPLMKAGKIRNIYFEFGFHQTKNGETFKDFHDHLSSFGYDIYKSQRATNFFGFAAVPQYHPQFELEGRTVEMILATLDTPSPDYRGPRVIGQPLQPHQPHQPDLPPKPSALHRRILRRLLGSRSGQH